MDKSQPKLVNILSNKQSGLTARFYSSQTHSDYICKSMTQHQRQSQLIQHVINNRKDYYQNIHNQSSPLHSLFNAHQINQQNKIKVVVSKPFIKGINLHTYFLKLSQNLQILQNQQIRGLIAGLLDLFVRGGGCPFFVYTLQNIIIDDTNYLDINITSMTGFKFLVGQDKVLKQQQFRQIIHYLDVNVNSRSTLSSIYNYELMQYNFAALVLNIIFQKQILLIKIPQEITKSQLPKYLKQIQTEWYKFLKLKPISQKINLYQSFIGEGANLTDFLSAILVQGKYFAWSKIRQLLFGLPKIHLDGSLNVFKQIADQKWNSLCEDQRNFFISRHFVETDLDGELLRETDKILYLNVMLGFNFRQMQGSQEFNRFLMQNKNYNKNYHKLWLFCIRQSLNSKLARPEPNHELQAKEILQNRQEIEHQHLIQQPQTITEQTNKTILQLYKIANNKLALSYKNATIQHQYLKSLRVFLRPLRQFFNPKAQ